MPKEEKTQTLEQEDSRSESSSEGSSLDSMRGRGRHHLFMETGDLEAKLEDENQEETGESQEVDNTQEEGDEGVEASAEEDSSEEEGPTDEQVDPELDALQKKLFASDSDRAKLKRDMAETKKRLSELAPLIDLGAAVQNDPELARAVRARLAKGTPKQQKAAGAGMDSPQFLNALRQIVREETDSAISTRVEVNRRLNSYDARAKQELPNFETISKHPEYLAHLTAWNNVVHSDEFEVPAEYADEPEFYAMKQAYNSMLAGNPEYQKAAKGATAKKVRENLEKKAAAASIGGGSKTTNVGEKQKLSQEEKDRVGILSAYRGWGRARKIPGGR